MKIERFAGHQEVLSVAGVTADYADRVFAFDDLILSALLKQQSRRLVSCNSHFFSIAAE